MFDHLVFRLLERIELGKLHVDFRGRQHVFGRGLGGPDAFLEVHDGSLFRDLLLHGEVGLGRSYVQRKWSTPDLESLTLLLNLNVAAFGSLIKGGSLFSMGSRIVEWWFQRRLSARKRSTPEASRHGMSVAYDVGEDFFRVMLGKSMLYSCAIYASPEDDLQAAQRHKIDVLIQKMDLAPEHAVLDIGCGWGTLLDAVGTRCGCSVRGISLSRMQVAYCRENVSAGRFDYLDYRDLPTDETYDRIVSVGMIEHVGHDYIQTFFDIVSRLLVPGGRAVLHTMVSGDALGFPAGVHLNSFASSTIMPVSYIPTNGELLSAINRSRGLYPIHAERFGPHYSQTMRHWRRNVLANAEPLAEQYSREHVRVYDYIWGMSSSCFASSNFDLLQLVVGKEHPDGERPVYDPRALGRMP